MRCPYIETYELKCSGSCGEIEKCEYRKGYKDAIEDAVKLLNEHGEVEENE